LTELCTAPKKLANEVAGHFADPVTWLMDGFLAVSEEIERY